MSQVLGWDSHRHLQSYLKAAISFGKPPLAFILEDPSHTEWTKWDIRIANAYQMMLDFEVEGWPVWIDQSPRVSFQVKTRKSKSAEALERKQWEEQKRAEKAKNYIPKFGERYYAIPQTIDGGPMPTKRDWIEEQREKFNSNQMKLASGKVVKTAADPEKMAFYRKKMTSRKSQTS